MKPRRLVSGPLIAQLLGLHRMSVNQAMRAGRYGEPIRMGGIVYVDLTVVEDYVGAPFTDKQIEAAVAGVPDRLLTIQTESEPEAA